MGTVTIIARVSCSDIFSVGQHCAKIKMLTASFGFIHETPVLAEYRPSSCLSILPHGSGLELYCVLRKTEALAEIIYDTRILGCLCR